MGIIITTGNEETRERSLCYVTFPDIMDTFLQNSHVYVYI